MVHSVHGPSSTGLPYRFTQMWSICARISWHWQTRTTLCITANVLQTNKVDAHSDKLATELKRQRSCQSMQQLHLHLTYPTCIWRLRRGDPVWVLPRFSASESSGYRVACLRDSTFSCLSTQTDRQKDRHRTIAKYPRQLKWNNIHKCT